MEYTRPDLNRGPFAPENFRHWFKLPAVYWVKSVKHEKLTGNLPFNSGLFEEDCDAFVDPLVLV